jgi:hypothetical protein
MSRRSKPVRGILPILVAVSLAAVQAFAAVYDPSIAHESESSAVKPEFAAAPEGASDTVDSGSQTAGGGTLARLRQSSSALGLRGYVQTELARAIASPEHWSKMLVRGELSAQGRFNEQVKWKLGARVSYDAVYDVTDFYPAEVRKDQRFEFAARENYLDIAAGNWDVRLGRQQIVWGEIVGLFFADVVSARDLREFLLPEFEILRIPQWAARAEYAGQRFHAELLWVPLPSYDLIGKPGAEFFPPLPPALPGFPASFRGEARPVRSLSNTNYGARVSTLRDGWDVSAFYYRSMDAAPTFYREIVVAGAQPASSFEARHDRIGQFGSTIAKDFGSVVAKAEAVYTRGRQFNVLRATDTNGLVPQNTLDWVAALDFSLPADTRLNLQAFQRLFFNHDPDILFRKHENGYSAMVTHEFTSALEGRVLLISSLARTDWMLRPRLAWKVEKNLRVVAGVDIFHGSPFGLFGRFANRDRAYMEVRYSF